MLYPHPQCWNPKRYMSSFGTKPALKCFPGDKEIINQERAPSPHAATATPPSFSSDTRSLGLTSPGSNKCQSTRTDAAQPGDPPQWHPPPHNLPKSPLHGAPDFTQMLVHNSCSHILPQNHPPGLPSTHAIPPWHQSSLEHTLAYQTEASAASLG